MRRSLRNLIVILGLTTVLGLLVPEHWQLPVEGADRRSYDQRSYWYHPWGNSVTHKGVDIFAKAGTPVNSATGGFVLYTGVMRRGSNVVLVLGPKWRLHYFAHLKDIGTGTWVSAGEAIGTVGITGCLEEPRTDGARSYRSAQRGASERGYRHGLSDRGATKYGRTRASACAGGTCLRRRRSEVLRGALKAMQLASPPICITRSCRSCLTLGRPATDRTVGARCGTSIRRHC